MELIRFEVAGRLARGQVECIVLRVVQKLESVDEFLGNVVLSNEALRYADLLALEYASPKRREHYYQT